MRRIAWIVLLMWPGFSVPAWADQLIAEYGAFIAPADLVNSQGAWLTQPWQVLRQDRANVHRFGIVQAGDDIDPVFGDFDNRGRLEALVQAGFISGSAAQSIMNGNVRVLVRVYGIGTRPNRVEVEVWNESPVTVEAEAPSTVVPGAPPAATVPDSIPVVAEPAL